MKNSNDLLDYEASDVQKNSIKTDQEGLLVRNNDEIKFEDSNKDNDIKAILAIEINVNNFILKLHSNNKRFLNEVTFFVIKYMKPYTEDNQSLVIRK
jgi:hypothetical protein